MTSGLFLLTDAGAKAPNFTLDRSLTLNLDGEELRIVHRPAAHTDGDVSVYFVKAGVVAIGDLAQPPDFLPYIGVDVGGTMSG